jgi:hypothetical protein
MNWWEKLTGIFYQPAKVFEQEKGKASWWLPLLILVAISIIVFLIIWKPVVMPEQIQKIMANGNIPDEGKSKAVEGMSGMMGYVFGLVGIVLGQPAVLLIVALVFWGVLSMMGGRTGFAQTFSVVTYSSLIGVASSAIKVPLMFIQHTAQVHTSLALILPPEMEETFLFRLLGQFDVFTIWTLFLMAIGFSIVAAVDRKKAYTAVFATWGVWVLLVAALGGMFKFGMQ